MGDREPDAVRKAPATPSFFIARKAGIGDAAGIAEIHVRSWQAAYRGLLADALLDALSVAEREEHWRKALSEASEERLVLVAEQPDGRLVGFCAAVELDPDGGAGVRTAEIGALYVDPSDWRRGVGTALLSAALEDLRERGCREAILWVLPENHAALSLYDRLGFVVEEGIERVEERSGRPVVRLRLGLSDAADRGRPVA